MRVEMLCGGGVVEIEVPSRAAVLTTKAVPRHPDPVGAVRAALGRPLDRPPLLELARGRKNAIVVVSDQTRPVPNRAILPPLLDILHQAGLGDDDITLIVATGLHPPVRGRELLDLLGPELPQRYRIVNHHGAKAELHAQVDEMGGQPIEIDRRYLEADLKILTGLIEPHLYAGYSGGAKSILPGLASVATMRFVHSFALLDHPRVRTGVVEGNPFQEAIGRVVERVGADLVVNVLINRNRELTQVLAGSPREVLAAGARAAEAAQVAHVARPMDLVITSGGGHPLDRTYFQANKGLVGAVDVARPGARILLVAECPAGLGGRDFIRILENCTDRDAFRAIHGKSENFVLDQWAAQSFFESRAHFSEVHLYAPGLAGEDFRLLGMTPVKDLQATLQRLTKGAEGIVAIPEGPFVVGRIQ